MILVLLLLGCRDLRGPEADPDVLILEALPVRTDFEATNEEVLDLGGAWDMRQDPDDLGVEEAWYHPSVDRSEWGFSMVPGTPNRDKHTLLDPYEGPVWLATTFPLEEVGDTAILRFGTCFLTCTYWLNGVELGTTERGYLPIELDVTDAVLPTMNTLVVRADNRITDTTVPVDTVFNPGRHGWFPYAGLTRGAELVTAPGAWVYDLTAIPDGDDLTLRIGVHATRSVEAALEVVLSDPDGAVVDSWKDRASLEAGSWRFTVDERVRDAARWSRETPANLYTVEAVLDVDGVPTTFAVRFGFREVGHDTERVAIDGVPAFLRGISRHEDDPATGPWQSDAHLEEDLALLQELGVNHIRPGHYPADPRSLRMFRDAGITIAEEIPVYQWSAAQMSDEALIGKAEDQLRAMIQRDRNNPAIVAWSLMNEVHSWNEAAGPFAARLAAVAKEQTPDRLTTFALQIVPGIQVGAEHVAPEVDLVGINEYYGWYYGENADVIEALEWYRDRFPDQTFLISEYGADAVLGTEAELAPEPVTDHSYAENWQAWYHEEHIEAFRELPWLGGMMPWAFADFYYEWDPPTGDHPAELTNLKGLVTLDRKTKAAFDVVREAYTGEAFDDRP